MIPIQQLRSAALAAERILTSAAVASGTLLLATAVAIGGYQVIARFILFQPASWSEPLIQGGLIWMAYLALAGAMRSGTLISVDILLRATEGTLHRFLRTFGTVAILLLLAVLVWFGAILCWRVRFQNLAGLNIPASFVYAALPVGSLVSMIALIAHVIDPPTGDTSAPDPSS